jgi:hypothetical protein
VVLHERYKELVRFMVEIEQITTEEFFFVINWPSLISFQRCEVEMGKYFAGGKPTRGFPCRLPRAVVSGKALM